MIKRDYLMEAPLQKLSDLLEAGEQYMNSTEESKLMFKETDDSWSKKEIIGHLSNNKKLTSRFGND